MIRAPVSTPSATSSRRKRRVSSAAITSALVSSATRRGEASATSPIGVAASTTTPVARSCATASALQTTRRQLTLSQRQLRASAIAHPGWRGAVLGERVRKAAAHKRQPQRAERAMGREPAEAFFPLRATTTTADSTRDARAAQTEGSTYDGRVTHQVLEADAGSVGPAAAVT